MKAEVFQIGTDLGFRRNAAKVVAPVARDDIDWFELRGGERAERVETADIPAFAVDPDEEVERLIETDGEVPLRVIRPALEGAAHWTFHDGSKTIAAPIEDQAFLARVHGGIESFRAGDVLRVLLRTVTERRMDGTLHPKSYRVLLVIEHLRVPTQISLLPSGD